MPSTLKNFLFPEGYTPWYVYDAVVNTVRAINRYDVLLSDAATGRFARAASAGDQTLNEGYVVALEERNAASGTDTIQVAAPGSLVPAATHAANLRPGAAVKAVNDTTYGTLVAQASAADIAAGRCLGRVRSLYEDHKLLRLAAAIRSHVLVQTGLI